MCQYTYPARHLLDVGVSYIHKCAGTVDLVGLSETHRLVRPLLLIRDLEVSRLVGDQQDLVDLFELALQAFAYVLNLAQNYDDCGLVSAVVILAEYVLSGLVEDLFQSQILPG